MVVCGAVGCIFNGVGFGGIWGNVGGVGVCGVFLGWGCSVWVVCGWFSILYSVKLCCLA